MSGGAAEGAGEQAWFALRVKPRHEKVVVQTLEAKGYQSLLPLYRRSEPESRRRREAELPLFPGYVFCHFNVLRRLPVVMTPSVLHIVGAGRTPAPVDAGEIAALEKTLAARVPVRPHPFLAAGQRVRITTGALAGVEGILVEIKKSLRLVISVKLLQRSVLVEIDPAGAAECAPAKPQPIHATTDGGCRPILWHIHDSVWTIDG